MSEPKVNSLNLEGGEEAPAQQYVFIDIMSCRRKVVLTVGYIFVAVASFFIGVAITRQVNGKGNGKGQESCRRLGSLSNPSSGSPCLDECPFEDVIISEQQRWIAVFADEEKVVYAALENISTFEKVSAFEKPTVEKQGDEKPTVSQKDMEEEIIKAAGGPGSGKIITSQDITLADGRKIKTSLYIFPLRLLGIAVGITLTVLLSSWQGFVAGCALALFTIIAELVIKCRKIVQSWDIGQCMKDHMTSGQFWKDSAWNLFTNILGFVDPTFSFIFLAKDGIEWAQDVAKKLVEASKNFQCMRKKVNHHQGYIHVGPWKHIMFFGIRLV